MPIKKISHKKILVVMAHPDDEVISCGGTIARHAAEGDIVHVVFVADGVTSRGYDPDKMLSRVQELKRDAALLSRRKVEATKALSLLGVDKSRITFFDLKDQRLDEYPLLDIIKRIEKVKLKVSPDIVYTHFNSDLNIDHCLVSRAVMTAFRPKPGVAMDVYLAEVPESTYLGFPSGEVTFKLNHTVDITPWIQNKINALKAYDSESRAYPDKRSAQYLKELAAHRGAKVKAMYAEAFIKI